MECITSSLDLFSKPPLDTSVDHVEDIEILPLSGITNDSAIDLVIPPLTSQYIDLSKTLLHLKIKVSSTDTANGIPANSVALIPLWPQALFRQIDMYLGQTLISTSTNQSPYRAWIETILSFPKNVQSDQLKVLEYIDGVTLPASKSGNKTLEALTRLNLDMMQQSRYLLNGVGVSIRLYRNSDAFVFKLASGLDSANYTISIEDISLFVRLVTPVSYTHLTLPTILLV